MVMHKELSLERWFELSLNQQMANVGMDVCRAISWRQKGDSEMSNQSVCRALELLDFTLADPALHGRRKEPARVRELLKDYFFGDNSYGFTDQAWDDYFYAFNYAAALERGL